MKPFSILSKTPFFLLSLSLLFLSSCGDDNEQSDTPPVNAGVEGYQLRHSLNSDAGYEVEVYSPQSFFVGYNRLAFRVRSGSGSALNDASVKLLPMMDMGTMMHTTPVEQPQYDADLEAYAGAATFIMPTTDMGRWTLKVVLEAPDLAFPDTLQTDITVETAEPARLFSFTDTTGTGYFVALRAPRSPELGLNPYSVMLYKRQSMMNFPPATGLEVAIEPRMPSMGHGSPNNVMPSEIAPGHYKGEVNFTMSGLWRIHTDVLTSEGDTLAGDSWFDITL
jgi:hypothetical protein